MGMYLPTSQILTVGAASAEFTSPMVVGYDYRLISTTACWVKISATGGSAAAAANSIYLPADTEIIIKATDSTNAYVQAIQVSGGGTANLARIG